MALKDDGCVIRGLGYVSLYAAYVEENIRECVRVMIEIRYRDHKVVQQKLAALHKRPVSKQIEFLEQELQKNYPLPAPIREMPELLEHLKGLFNQRNQIVHGYVYRNMHEDIIVLRPGRADGQIKELRSDELYQLANDFFAAIGNLHYAWRYGLVKLSSHRTHS